MEKPVKKPEIDDNSKYNTLGNKLSGILDGGFWMLMAITLIIEGHILTINIV